MALNSDKPERWANDIELSVHQFDGWFLAHAPETFRQERQRATGLVREALRLTNNLRTVDAALLTSNPSLTLVLRHATAPPLARDRLMGITGVPRGLIKVLELGRVPKKSRRADIQGCLITLAETLTTLFDNGLLPWREQDREPTEGEIQIASFVIADRLCGASSDAIIRNAHQIRQRKIIENMLIRLSYREKAHPRDQPLNFMEPGTFAFSMNVASKAKVPVDVVIQPKQPTSNRTPLFVELKAAGDFTNVNKRRKEESDKFRNLRETYGSELRLILFLCGYFDQGYLKYEAEAGIDWVWEHRADDLLLLGLG